MIATGLAGYLRINRLARSTPASVEQRTRKGPTPRSRDWVPTTPSEMKYRDIIRLIENDGWRVAARRGSHQQYEHPTKSGKVTVAGKPNVDVPKGTAANILRQAGLRRSS